MSLFFNTGKNKITRVEKQSVYQYIIYVDYNNDNNLLITFTIFFTIFLYYKSDNLSISFLNSGSCIKVSVMETLQVGQLYFCIPLNIHCSMQY